MLTITVYASALITIAITTYGALATSKHGGQSMRESMLETWTNIVIW